MKTAKEIPRHFRPPVYLPIKQLLGAKKKAEEVDLTTNFMSRGTFIPKSSNFIEDIKFGLITTITTYLVSGLFNKITDSAIRDLIGIIMCVYDTFGNRRRAEEDAFVWNI